MKENSIEEDIARISKLLTTKFNNDYSIDNKDKEALEHILSDYKRVLKENEELHKEIDQMKSLDIYKLVEDWETGQLISIQKVKDKIEKEIKYHEKNILDIENITILKSKTAKEEAEIEFNKYAIVVLKKMLQELLEGKNKMKYKGYELLKVIAENKIKKRK